MTELFKFGIQARLRVTVPGVKVLCSTPGAVLFEYCLSLKFLSDRPLAGSVS